MDNGQLNSPCSASPKWWTTAHFRPFYLEDDPTFPEGGSPPRVAKNPAKRLKPDLETEQFDDRTWKRIKVDIVWTPGIAITESPNDEFNFEHWHTTFVVSQRVVHVDFTAFFRMGPQTGYREYRVFVDGEQVGRGGGFVGFIGGIFYRHRNWPLAVIVSDYLIYIGGLLRDWTDKPDKPIDTKYALSVWKLVT